MEYHPCTLQHLALGQHHRLGDLLCQTSFLNPDYAQPKDISHQKLKLCISHSFEWQLSVEIEKFGSICPVFPNRNFLFRSTKRQYFY